jgi:hypothetical protein
MAAYDIPSPEASINTDAVLHSNQYQLIRSDGTETTFSGRPSFDEIHRLIGHDSLDTVTIDRRRQTVTLVDDTGMLDGKPVNVKATALYHAICRPGTVWAIHGDVVIVPAGGLSR